MVLPLLIFLPPSWWWWWCMSDNNKFSNQAFSTSNIIILWCLNDTTYYVLLRPYSMYCMYDARIIIMNILCMYCDRYFLNFMIQTYIWYAHVRTRTYAGNNTGYRHEKSYDKNRRKSKGEIMNNMFNNGLNQLEIG